MTNPSKVNAKQKQIMGEFMVEHHDLAKNRIPNNAQGKMTSNRLWNELTGKLNTSGPPIKNSTSWRKVFADQKHQVKLKLSKNKASKRKTGGGPYEEFVLTPTDENIVLTAGLTAAVEGLSSVKTFGSTSKTICSQLQAKKKPPRKDTEKENAQGFQKSSSKEVNLSTQLEQLLESDNGSLISETSSTSQYSETAENINFEMSDKPGSSSEPNTFDPRRRKVTKLSLLEKSMEKNDAWRQEKREFFQKLIKLKERSLKIKEDELNSNLAITQVDLEIKKLQLDMLSEPNMEM